MIVGALIDKGDTWILWAIIIVWGNYELIFRTEVSMG